MGFSARIVFCVGLILAFRAHADSPYLGQSVSSLCVMVSNRYEVFSRLDTNGTKVYAFGCTVCTTNPPTILPQGWLFDIDEAIFTMIEPGYDSWVRGWVTGTVPRLDIVSTSWYWSVAEDRWLISGYDARVVPATRADIFRAAGLPIVTITNIVDRGPTYPKTVTNKLYWGWQNGQLSVYSYEPPIDSVASIERYQTHVWQEACFSLPPPSNVVLASVHFGRRFDSDAIQLDGRNDIAGIYYWTSSLSFSGFIRNGGGAAIPYAVGTNMYYHQYIFADANYSLTNAIAKAPGPVSPWRLPVTYSGESSSWTARWPSRAIVSFPGYDLSPPVSGPQSTINPAVWLYPTGMPRSLVVQAPTTPLPVPISVRIVGETWSSPTRTTGWARVVVTNLVLINSAGSVPIPTEYVMISSLSVTSSWGEYYYPLHDVHIQLVAPVFTASYASSRSPLRVPWVLTESAIAQRKRILRQLISSLEHVNLNLTAKTLSGISDSCGITESLGDTNVSFYAALIDLRCGYASFESSLEHSVEWLYYGYNDVTLEYECRYGNYNFPPEIVEYGWSEYRYNIVKDVTGTASVNPRAIAGRLKLFERVSGDTLVDVKKSYLSGKSYSWNNDCWGISATGFEYQEYRFLREPDRSKMTNLQLIAESMGFTAQLPQLNASTVSINVPEKQIDEEANCSFREELEPINGCEQYYLHTATYREDLTEVEQVEYGNIAKEVIAVMSWQFNDE